MKDMNAIIIAFNEIIRNPLIVRFNNIFKVKIALENTVYLVW